MRASFDPSFVVRNALLGLVVAAAFGPSCVVESIFTCGSDEDCVAEGGEGGVCESNIQCTFPDESCEEGKRWHERAVEELAGQCYDPTQLGGSGSATEGSSGSGSSGTGAASSGSTAAGDDVADDGSDDAPMTSAESSGEPPASDCDAQFGSANGYELCQETDMACVFNAVLDQSTCDDLCMSFGTTCVTAFNNEAGDCASAADEAPCSEAANDQICACAK